ncbi:MAG: acyl-CoA dehydrogenase [Chloroflexi bacterium]|nr:acyl-CoA dehydrogenase [Chloroflexota bacterium]MBT7081770.1 acyl-CoA dehydrogenase [Chloroflexota bacterium]MBT7289410.1 acyl-CoA dehydrogenase [Chloroflexota bacterium]
MDYSLNEQQKMMRSLARQIAEEKILPVRAEYDEKEIFPWDVVKALSEAGLFGVFIPEEYGGLGGGNFDLCLVVEELSRVCGGIALAYAATALGATPIIEAGSDELKKRYLPRIADGTIAAFGLTEAEAGSDAAATKASAVKADDGSYIVNGTKRFISNGGDAEIYSIIAMTDKTKGPRGATALVVDKDTPGFTFGKKEKKMGIRANSTRELVYDDCKIPSENLIGKEGYGFIIAMKTLDKSRAPVGSQAVGIAQGAFEASVAHARERKQFDKPLASLQAISHMLADMGTQIEAARALVYAAARHIDTGAKHITEEGSMAKLFASEVAMRVTTDAVQIHGGIGYMRDFPIEKMMRDAKITQIYEGTSQILKNDIAPQILKRRGLRQ